MSTSGQVSHPIAAIGTEARNPEAQGAPCRPADKAVEVNCELCQQPVLTSFIRHHMGAHLLPSTTWPARYTRPAEPCGLCGIRPAHGQYLVDPSITEGCPVSLSKTTGTWRAVHQCKLAGEVTYSLAPAGKSYISTPCTNVPLQCPSCPLFIWSNNVASHYTDRHPAVTIPPAALAAAELGVHEAEWLPHLLGLKAVPDKAKCKRAGCVCGVASRKRKK